MALSADDADSSFTVTPKEAASVVEEVAKPAPKKKTAEAKRKRCIKFIARNCKKKTPQEIYDLVVKKYEGIMTAEEVAECCASQLESKPDSSEPPAAANEAPAAPSVPSVGGVIGSGEAESSSPKQAKKRAAKFDGLGWTNKKSKQIGRPPDEQKQRTIIETVRTNPTISLRSVAASVDCSKSQVARILALNGYQRNKGRIGEWQCVKDTKSLTAEGKPDDGLPILQKEPEPILKADEKKPREDEDVKQGDQSIGEMIGLIADDTVEERPQKKKRTG